MRAFSPRKPKRSHEQRRGDLLAVAERRAAAHLLQRLEHAQLPGELGRVLREMREPHRRAALDLARRSARARRRAACSSVVLPEPLTPTSATRSPGPRRQVTSCSTSRAPSGSETSTASSTLLPRREVAKRSSSTRSRAGGSSAISALAASIRNFGLRRARRRAAAQPRELLAQQLSAAVLARGRLAVALGAGEHVGRVAALVLVDAAVGDLPRLRCRPRRGTSGRGSRRAATRAARRGGGEPVDAFDVEVVGRLVEQQQLGVVEQQPRERDAPPLAAGERPIGVVDPGGKRSSSTPPSSPSSTPRNARSPGPLVLGALADEHLADRRAVGEVVALAEQRDPQPAQRASAARRRRLEPAISRSSVDLPSPLPPTTPMRSPAETPSVMSSRTVRLP